MRPLSLDQQYARLAAARRSAERAVDEGRWWQRRRRRDALARLRRREESDGLDAAAADWARQLLADEITNAWARRARGANHRDPRLLEHLPGLAEEASADAIDQAGPDPRLLPLLTVDAAMAIAHEQVAQIRAVVDDPTIHFTRTTIDDKLTVVVQHAASGLRARFTGHPGSSAGVVMSKPWDIPSINPDDPHDGGYDWERFTGLGIGRRLYLAAADLAPQLRWPRGLVSTYAEPLRDRLHAADPFRWDGASCHWCQTRGILWSDAAQSDYYDHPVAPAPPAVAPQLIEVDTRIAY